MRGPAYSDIDGSPTKELVVSHKDDPAFARFFKLACGKRPAEELYDLQKDPHQLHNVASEPEYDEVKEKLRARLDRRLSQTGDPRANGDWEDVDAYPYYGHIEGKE